MDFTDMMEPPKSDFELERIDDVFMVIKKTICLFLL